MVDTQNLPELGDLAGFRADFLKIFGFGIEGVDYDAEVNPNALAEPHGRITVKEADGKVF